MTTRLHITNFGPGNIEVGSDTDTTPIVLYPQTCTTVYTYSGQKIIVKEIQEVIPVVKEN